MALINIIVGWANYVKDRFDLLDDATKELANERLKHCDVCEIRNGTICDPNKTILYTQTNTQVSGCGCHIAAKTLDPGSKCPAGKW